MFKRIVILSSLLFLGACSSLPQEILEHEEYHCEGWTHIGTPQNYTWRKSYPSSIKPWIYVYVTDVNLVCRSIGADPNHELSQIHGCATWKPANCIIYVQENSGVVGLFETPEQRRQILIGLRIKETANWKESYPIKMPFGWKKGEEIAWFKVRLDALIQRTTESGVGLKEINIPIGVYGEYF